MACQGLSTLATDCCVADWQTLAVEVLWTPQDEGDYYTRDEVFADFPTLNNL